MNGFRDQLVDSLSGVNGDITIYDSNKDKIKKIQENNPSISFVENQDFSVRLREDGLLEAKGPTIDRILKKDILGFGDLHVWEYQLFWNYLRENASHRTNVYFEKYES